jgi:hypothetical protein
MMCSQSITRYDMISSNQNVLARHDSENIKFLLKLSSYTFKYFFY